MPRLSRFSNPSRQSRRASLGSHVPILSQQLHPSAFILRTTRSLRNGRVPKFVDNVIHILGRGFDGKRAGGTAEAPITGSVALIEVEIDEWNVLQLDVLPDIHFGPVQQWMDSDMGPRWEVRLELIPQLRRLIAKIPVPVLVARREIALLGPRPFLIGSDAENNSRVTLLLDELFEPIGLDIRSSLESYSWYPRARAERARARKRPSERATRARSSPSPSTTACPNDRSVCRLRAKCRRFGLPTGEGDSPNHASCAIRVYDRRRPALGPVHRAISPRHLLRAPVERSERKPLLTCLSRLRITTLQN